jgi:hypothetical protein
VNGAEVGRSLHAHDDTMAGLSPGHRLFAKARNAETAIEAIGES